MEHYCCQVCESLVPLAAAPMAELQCDCSVCPGCAREHIQAQLLQPWAPSAAAAAAAAPLAVGDAVRYKDRHGTFVDAVVVQVDRSIQPPGYGVRLAGAAADEIRFTEQSRLLPAAGLIQPGLLPIPCPRCGRVVEPPVLARLFPDELAQLEEQLTNSWLQAQGVIRCPSCQALIEKVPPQSGAVTCTCPPASSSSSSSGSSRCRCAHRQQHRFRCAAPQCGKTFCDSCFAQPYHEGLDCREAAAPHCPLCDALVLAAADIQTASLSTKQLRVEATALGVDCSWCLERSELVEACQRAKQTCEDCRPRLRMMCGKQLPCRHWCCGVRATGGSSSSSCLPCLQEGCQAQAAAVGDGLCCFCFDPLVSAPVITLSCSHFVHLACARQRLKTGCPGPALTFDYLFCPLCGSGSEGRRGNVQVMTAQPDLRHELLNPWLQEALDLRQQVIALAKARLKLTRAQLTKEDADLLSPGGKFDGRPVDFALSRFQFFRCHACKECYYGGLRECGGAAAQQAPAAAAYDESELVCGSCAAVAAGGNCPDPSHGTKFIEWKCKYCCQVASWFCWGTTHMCSRCHEHPEQRQHACPGTGRCMLKVPHPPPGSGHCLGCGLCRGL